MLFFISMYFTILLIKYENYKLQTNYTKYKNIIINNSCKTMPTKHCKEDGNSRLTGTLWKVLQIKNAKLHTFRDTILNKKNF